MAKDPKKATYRSERQAERAVRRASHALLRAERRNTIRRAMAAQESFMAEYVRVHGDLELMDHPLAEALVGVDGPESVKEAVTRYYESLGRDSEPPR